MFIRSPISTSVLSDWLPYDQCVFRIFVLLPNNNNNMANTIGGSKLFIPKPPAKGSFPLDHYGECKHLMKQYTECLRETGSKVTTKCQSIAREYLECRMDKDLMVKEDLKYLGFNTDDDKSQN
ncbi:cytochrome c oxidase assembly protein COX19 [Dermatophagoides farinae]|uniref:cytochrome c oxidase assembly protein COX19 n=1 Tax=Dermatophagoides farinae TaxID=6954 RepID=UPI003F5D9941